MKFPVRMKDDRVVHGAPVHGVGVSDHYRGSGVGMNAQQALKLSGSSFNKKLS